MLSTTTTTAITANTTHPILHIFPSFLAHTGEVLTTRVYREFEPAPSTTTDAGATTTTTPTTTPTPRGASIELVSYGVPCVASAVSAHAVSTIWEAPEALDQLEQRLRATTTTATATTSSPVTGSLCDDGDESHPMTSLDEDEMCDTTEDEGGCGAPHNWGLCEEEVANLA